MNKKLTSVLKLIDASKNILLLCHSGPDADSVASNLAAKYWLDKKGKKVSLFTPDPLPKNLDFLPGFSAIQQRTLDQVDQSSFDLLLSLDSASWKMIGKKLERTAWKKPLAVIDHHVKNDLLSDASYVTDQSSTSEIIFDIFTELNIKFPKEIALILLTGIYADTQAFKLSNVKPEVLEKAGKLMRLGADISTVSFNQERRVPFKKISYWSVYLANMKVNEKYKYCWTTVSRKEFDSDVVDGEPKTGNLFLPIVDGTDFGFSLRESNDGFIWGSFRSRTLVDSSIFARGLGGGGHPGGSAFNFKPGTSMAEAEKAVQQVIADHYQEFTKNG